ncbi:MAG: hypothetical protein ABSC25_12915 [Roseiarcus sp.]|jgi:hypothetical protein
MKELSADQAIAFSKDLRSNLEHYLKEMSVPSKYAELMFSIPPDNMRWVSSAEFKTDFRGVIPELEDWLTPRCGTFTEAEKLAWDALKKIAASDRTPVENIAAERLDSRIETFENCYLDNLVKLSRDAENDFRKRLAEKGDTIAQFGYGESLFRPNVFLHVRAKDEQNGSVVNDDQQKALDGIQWLTRSANQCYEYAQRELVDIYAGYYLERLRNYVDALKWLDILQAYHDHGYDYVRLYGFDSKMTPAEIDEAKRLAGEWRPRQELDTRATCKSYDAECGLLRCPRVA